MATDDSLDLQLQALKGTLMTPLKHSTSFAAPHGPVEREPLEDRRVRLAGVVVAISLFLSMQLGTKFIDQNDANVGESRTADRMINDAGFTVDDKGETIEEHWARWCSCSRRR